MKDFSDASGKTMPEIVIIGGGAAGMMLAARLCDAGLSERVLLIEKNASLGKKLAITGKGRCNVTNDCGMQDFLENVPTNARFLYSAYAALPPRELMAFFEAHGVPLKVERGNRVFPVSDKASDIVRALDRAVTCRRMQDRVTGLVIENGVLTGVRTQTHGTVDCRAAAVCTGGLSYPRTGSDGDGYQLARQAGLEVLPTSPSLVPLVCAEPYCAQMQGLSLRNTALTMTDTRTGKTVYEDFGEMMFTHFGVTGPMILSASAHLSRPEEKTYRISLDLKPALDEKTLDKRILSDFEKYSNKDLCNALGDLLPRKMIPVVIALTGIDERKKINEITKAERQTLISVLKHFPLTPIRFRPIDEAIITRGGVSVRGIDPKTMQSKQVKGLYFCGEVLDCDAYTGGFNLQIAFSTAALAASALAASALAYSEKQQ